MATRKGQRIAIWVIAITMLVGTIGAFAAMIIDPTGGAEVRQQAELERQMEEQKKFEEQMNEMARARAESSKPLEGYDVSEFDKGAVTKLDVEILKQGDGDIIEPDSTILANYFGWTSSGAIFDSTNQDGETEPIKFSLQQVIKGWTEGLSGARVGSVVKLTIPADKAYGEAGSPPNIGPNEPLRFIVEVREKVEEA